MTMNIKISRYVILSYPNFIEEFIIHTYAHKKESRGVIIQNGKRIDFYSRKLTPAQIKYAIIEGETLSIS